MSDSELIAKVSANETAIGNLGVNITTMEVRLTKAQETHRKDCDENIANLYKHIDIKLGKISADVKDLTSKVDTLVGEIKGTSTGAKAIIEILKWMVGIGGLLWAAFSLMKVIR